jgi:hypothetical protein
VARQVDWLVLLDAGLHVVGVMVIVGCKGSKTVDGNNSTRC